VIDLRHGRWQDVLGDVHRVDVCICDPPFSERTHAGQRHGRKDNRYCDSNEHPILSSRGLEYMAWNDADIAEFITSWSPRCSGWLCIFTSHDLVGAYTTLLEAQDRYVFAPVACVQYYRNVRLAGDGPANWTDYLIVSRPRTMSRWGALPGAYVGQSFDFGENALDRSKRIVAGAKPLWLMRAIVRDYSRPGNLIVDPCAGGATTLIAAAVEDRGAIGAEMDKNTHALAMKRIAAGHTPNFPIFNAPQPAA
jgi:site-specific DNA-methyltransferase (adenine-specific)